MNVGPLEALLAATSLEPIAKAAAPQRSAFEELVAAVIPQPNARAAKDDPLPSGEKTKPQLPHEDEPRDEDRRPTDDGPPTVLTAFLAVAPPPPRDENAPPVPKTISFGTPKSSPPPALGIRIPTPLPHEPRGAATRPAHPFEMPPETSSAPPSSPPPPPLASERVAFADEPASPRLPSTDGAPPAPTTPRLASEPVIASSDFVPPTSTLSSTDFTSPIVSSSSSSSSPNRLPLHDLASRHEMTRVGAYPRRDVPRATAEAHGADVVARSDNARPDGMARGAEGASAPRAFRPPAPPAHELPSSDVVATRAPEPSAHLVGRAEDASAPPRTDITEATPTLHVAPHATVDAPTQTVVAPTRSDGAMTPERRHDVDTSRIDLARALHHETRAEVNIPEAGKIAVSAHARADVRLDADQAGTARTLAAHAHELASDLRDGRGQARVAVSGPGVSMEARSGGGSHTPHRRGEEEREEHTVRAPKPGSRRVRFVL